MFEALSWSGGPGVGGWSGWSGCLALLPSLFASLVPVAAAAALASFLPTAEKFVGSSDVEKLLISESRKTPESALANRRRRRRLTDVVCIPKAEVLMLFFLFIVFICMAAGCNFGSLGRVGGGGGTSGR